MKRNWLRYLIMALALLMAVVMLASLIVPYIGL